MKYFTSDWWASACEGADVLFERYRQYIESVRHRLPTAALDLDEKHTLHDSTLKEVTADFSTRRVRLELLGWNTGFDTRTRYQLTFAEVALFEQHLPEESHEPSFGDLGYWEWEALPEGTELRILFASSACFGSYSKTFGLRTKACSLSDRVPFR